MRALVLLVVLLLTAAPVLAQANNTTGQANDSQTNQTQGNDTDDNVTNGEDGPPELPERQGHVPWVGLIVGVLAFFGAVVISRETDTGQP